MASSLAEVAAQAKTAIAQLIAATEGLRPADGVTVASVAADGLPQATTVLLGNVTILDQGPPGLKGQRGAFNLAGWVYAFPAGSDTTTITAARTLGADLMARIERAITTDRTVAGAIPGPGGTVAVPAVLEEGMGDWMGQSVRQIRVPFNVTWTSHIQ